MSYVSIYKWILRAARTSFNAQDDHPEVRYPTELRSSVVQLDEADILASKYLKWVWPQELIFVIEDALDRGKNLRKAFERQLLACNELLKSTKRHASEEAHRKAVEDVFFHEFFATEDLVMAAYVFSDDCKAWVAEFSAHHLQELEVARGNYRECPPDLRNVGDERYPESHELCAHEVASKILF